MPLVRKIGGDFAETEPIKSKAIYLLEHAKSEIIKQDTALTTAHLRILALETTLQQAVTTSERRQNKLSEIKQSIMGRWPFVLKRTIRNIL